MADNGAPYVLQNNELSSVGLSELPIGFDQNLNPTELDKVVMTRINFTWLLGAQMLLV